MATSTTFICNNCGESVKAITPSYVTKLSTPCECGGTFIKKS